MDTAGKRAAGVVTSAAAASALGADGYGDDGPAARRWAPWGAAALAVAVFVVGAYGGTNAVGGSDSHCYVGQARMFMAGEARLPPPLAGRVAWPDAPATFVPSGFVAVDAAGNGVPLCPAGLPVLMVGAMALGGQSAWFWVVPLLGALAIWSTFLLGSHVAGRTAGLGAAFVVACSPIFLYQIFQPMSDVPAAALWAAALAAATARNAERGPRPATALVSGIAAGLAVMVRPNLAPLVAVPALLIAWHSPARAWRQAAWFLAGLVPGVAAVAALQDAVYGAPWRSGYGALEQLFSLSNVGTNLPRYLTWMSDVHTPVLFLAVLAPLAARPRRTLAALLAFSVATLAAYLPYVPFDDWSYTRFLLPAVPPLVVLWVALVQSAAARATRAWAPAAVMLAAVALGGWWLQRATDLSVFEVKALERKYPELGRYAATRLPANAIVLGAQSTGAIRYYANKPTLSWDAIDPAWLERVAAEVTERGLEPYLVVESFETDRFRSRFRGHSPLGQLDWPPRATFGRAIALYHLSDRARYLRGERIPTDRVNWRVK